MSTSGPTELTPKVLDPHADELLAYEPPRRPSALDSSPDAMALFMALRRCWPLALGLGLLAAAVTGPLAWYFWPRGKFTAAATVFVGMNPKRVVFEPHDSLTDPRTYQKTQIARLTDRTVLGPAIANVENLPTIKELLTYRRDPYDWLKENLKAAFISGSEVLEVSLSGDREDDLPRIVNEVVTSYMKVVVDAEKKERFNRLDQLRKLLDGYQIQLKAKRKSLVDVAASVGMNDKNAIAMTQQFKLAQLSVAQGEHVRTQSELLKAQVELRALEGKPDEQAKQGKPSAVAAPEPADSPQVDKHPDVVRLAAQVQEQARRYDELSRGVRNKSDPAVMAAYRRWQRAYQDWQAGREDVRNEVASGVAPTVRNDGTPMGREQAAARLRTRIEVLGNYKTALAKDMEDFQNDIKKMAQGALDLENEKEEISISSEFARKVGSEAEFVQVEMEASPRIYQMSPAEVPRVVDEYRKLKAGAVAALGAFALVFVGISFLESRTRRISTADEVVDKLGMRLVGAIPAPGNRLRRLKGRAGAPSHREHSVVESVDAMRTVLLHAFQSQSLRVVMVTSAVKGEGKTTLSCHLAVSLARAGRKTLLVEFDLRRPTLRRLFDLPSGAGICEFLRGEAADPNDLIVAAPLNNLDVLPAGNCDPLALQALATPNLVAEMFHKVEAGYDFVVVDSAPVLPVADSLLIAQSVDGVIFSLMRDVSRLPEVYTATERLSSLGVKVLGAVVSGVHNDAYYPEYHAVS